MTDSLLSLVFAFPPFVILLGWVGSITAGHTKRTLLCPIKCKVERGCSDNLCRRYDECYHTVCICDRERGWPIYVAQKIPAAQPHTMGHPLSLFFCLCDSYPRTSLHACSREQAAGRGAARRQLR